MNSMQDALTDALAHPITDARPRASNFSRSRSKGRGGHKDADAFWWGAVGSLIGSLLFIGILSKRRTKPGEKYPPPAGWEAVD
ncbi:MAG: hypothetical protein ABI995_07610 [Acidobacteriota bacterium]